VLSYREGRHNGHLLICRTIAQDSIAPEPQ
jgi:hypothetical protein